MALPQGFNEQKGHDFEKVEETRFKVDHICFCGISFKRTVNADFETCLVVVLVSTVSDGEYHHTPGDKKNGLKSHHPVRYTPGRVCDIHAPR